MKTNLTLIVIAVCMTIASSEVVAQEEKVVTLHGVVESVDGNNITVNHRRKSKIFTINDQTQFHYVGFLKAKKEIKPGFFVRAGVDSKGRCNQLWVTLPIPDENLKPSAQMLTMTPAELHQMADTNGDGQLSYVEYARVGFGKKVIKLAPGEEPATITASCLLESDATVALIVVSASIGSVTDPIELGGYFVDNVQLTATRQPTLPVDFVK